MEFVLWFYLMVPAYIANMAPVFVKRIPWNLPVDFGLSWNGSRLLGNNKTWKGVFAGMLTGLLAGFILSLIFWPFGFSAVLWGLLAGFGAVFGDVIKSFFKRRFNVAPGSPWIPFDQIDFSVGALLVGSLLFFPGWLAAFVIVCVSAVGHVLVNRIGFLIGVRDVKW